MTKMQLDSFLTKSIPRAVLLYGESDFMITYYADVILQKLHCQYQSMYFEEYNHEEALNHLGVNDLFGNRNVLLLKLYVALSKIQIQELLYMLERNPDSFLIVQLYKSPSITSADYAKRFKAMSAIFKPTEKLQHIFEVRFYQPSHDDMIKILQQKAHSLGLQVSPHILEYLLIIQNYDILIAYSELDKFVYFPMITKELIDSLSYGLGNVKIESLLDSVFDKKGRLVEIIDTLHDEGIDDMEILREITRYFYILFKLYGHSKKYGKIDSVEALGYKAPIQTIAIWSKRSLKLTTQKYCTLFDILNLWRVQQFQGKNVSLQYLIEIQRIL